MGDETNLYNLPGFYEPFSAISHLFGAVVFLYLGVMLLRRGRGSRRRMIFLGIYVVSCVFLMSISGVYHMMVRGDASREVLARLDHGAIFLFIAGTFTPVHGLLFRGWLRWAPLFIIWGAAITGVTLKTVFFNDLPEWLGLIFYFAMGWVGTFTGILLARRFGFAFIKPLILGGLAYTIGGIIDYQRWAILVPGVVQTHELFHVAVLMGAFWHWQFVWQMAAGTHSLHHRAPSITDDPPKFY